MVVSRARRRHCERRADQACHQRASSRCLITLTRKLPKLAVALSTPEHLAEHVLVGYEDGSLALLDLSGIEQATTEPRPCTTMRVEVAATSTAVVRAGTLAIVAAIRLIRHDAQAPASPAKGKGKKRKSLAAESSGPRWTAEVDLFAVVDGRTLEHASTTPLPCTDVLDVAFDVASGFATVLGSYGFEWHR